MPMQTTRSWTRKIAFVLGEQSLRQILTIMSSVSEDIGYILECSDRSTITCSSLDEVLGFQNSKRRRIRGLILHTPYDQPTYVQVRFREDVSLDPIECTVRGNDETVLILSSRLDDSISSLTQWYGVLAFYSTAWLLLLTTGLLLLGLIGIGAFGHPDHATNERIEGLRLGGVILATVFLTFGVTWVQNALFPRSVFLIGDGRSRYNRIVFFRRSLILPFLIGLIVWRVTTR